VYSEKYLFAHPSASHIPPAWKLGLNCPWIRLDISYLCYSITSMKADNVGRKGDELAMALYPIRSRARDDRPTRSEGLKFFCKTSTIFESAVISYAKHFFIASDFLLLLGPVRQLRVFKTNARQNCRSSFNARFAKFGCDLAVISGAK
jgi:hypothetical protein